MEFSGKFFCEFLRYRLRMIDTIIDIMKIIKTTITPIKIKGTFEIVFAFVE